MPDRIANELLDPNSEEAQHVLEAVNKTGKLVGFGFIISEQVNQEGATACALTPSAPDGSVIYSWLLDGEMIDCLIEGLQSIRSKVTYVYDPSELLDLPGMEIARDTIN